MAGMYLFSIIYLPLIFFQENGRQKKKSIIQIQNATSYVATGHLNAHTWG
jgi:hypothetical protein